jgi:hypothetical protein
MSRGARSGPPLLLRFSLYKVPVGVAPLARGLIVGNTNYRSARALAVNPGTPNGVPPSGFGG